MRHQQDTFDDYLRNLWEEPSKESEDDLLAFDMMIQSLATGTENKPYEHEIEIFPDHEITELLGDFTTRNSTEKPPDKGKKKYTKKSMTQRFREEKEYLDRRIEVLQKTLNGLKRKREVEESSIHKFSWQAHAREEALKRQKSVQLNTDLKKALQQQLRFTQSINKVFQQLPEIVVPTIEDPAAVKLRLGQTMEERRARMHAIADKVYADFLTDIINPQGLVCRSVQPVFVEGGAKVSMTNTFDFEIIRDEVLSIDYDKFCSLFYLNSYSSNITVGKMSVRGLECMEDGLLYTQRTLTGFSKYGGANVTTNIIRKRYQESGRDIIIWTSVDEDEMYPIDSRHGRYREFGYRTVEKVNNPKTGKSSTRLVGKTTIMPFLSDGLCTHMPGVTTENILNGIRETLQDFRAKIKSYEEV